jgi:hypothetical protein
MQRMESMESMKSIIIRVVDSYCYFSEKRRKRLKHVLRPQLLALASSSFLHNSDNIEENKDLELVGIEKGLMKEFPGERFQILWPPSSSEVMVEIMERKNEEKVVDISSPSPTSKSANKLRLQQRLATLRSSRQSISTLSGPSEAWNMYHQLLSKNPAMQSTLPSPKVILEKKEEFTQLMTSPFLQGPKQATFLQYLQKCLQ